jgi:PAS domain S-box-containing protein
MNPARILIVEDESIVALDIKDRLAAMGYEVCGVADRGEEALSRAGADRPDLVLMDIRLKGEMDGIAAAAEVRKLWNIPVVYLTAFSEEHTLRRAKITEPFGYIIKPFEDREIRSAIEMALYKHQAETRLRESERRYATTLTSIGDGVVATDPQGRVTFMNPAAEKLTGWPAADAHGRPLAEVFKIVSEQTGQAVENPVDRVLREGRTVGLAGGTLLLSRDGRQIPVDDCAAPILTESGALSGTVLVFQDGSARRQAEEKLRLTQFAVDRTADAAFWMTPDARLFYVNEAACRDLGYAAEELLAKTALDISPDYLREAWPEHWRELKARKTTVLETVHQAKDGRVYPVEIRANFLEFGGREYNCAFARDITRRKQAEAELSKSRETLLAVLEGVDAAIYAADMQSHEILFMNKHMIEAFGADLTGRRCFEAFRGESAPCGHCTNDRLLGPAGAPAGVCVWESRDPVTGKWTINRDRAVRWVDGRMVRLQTATDVTKLKELELERSRMQEQLRQAQKMESVGRLAGGVAHDFNNMLSAILGYSELAMIKTRPSEPIMDDLKAIKGAALRSADLVRQLLAFARRQIVSPKLLDLNDTVSGMLKMLKRLIGEDIDLAWKPGGGLWTVRVDPSQVDQILANLCVNARDAIPGVGKVTIETANAAFEEDYCAAHPGFTPGQFVMLAVSDNGCGMEKELLDQIFEPFFTTKEIGKGTGLGLATVYGIVKQNEGFVNVYSEPGRGTTFKVYLPRFAGEALDPAAEGFADLPAGCGELVLLVEDEKAILNVGRAMLESLGYKVVAAQSPGEALRHAEERSGDLRLLITDVVMPEMNGRDLAGKISALAPGLKCLYASGYPANVIAHHGVLDAGVQFLQKPFSLKELASKVRQTLDR